MGAVVNESQYRKILQYVDLAHREARVLTGGEPVAGSGWLVTPAVVADVEPGSRLEQEEIFGPVLSVIRARDFDDALRIANDTEFGLTGGVYTDDPEKIERAKREFFVGNLYVNRKCTGGIVGAQPFGGFNMSGTDSKAGGRDYLQLFLQAKSITERKAPPAPDRAGGESETARAESAVP
jgi:1-pyrroline-5-carboxylate dehydrogenase